jgi:hypothetical protein
MNADKTRKGRGRSSYGDLQQLRKFGVPSVATPLGKLSRARQLASGNHSQVFNVLTDQKPQFGKNHPCIVVCRGGRKHAEVPNFVF